MTLLGFSSDYDRKMTWDGPIIESCTRYYDPDCCYPAVVYVIVETYGDGSTFGRRRGRKRFHGAFTDLNEATRLCHLLEEQHLPDYFGGPSEFEVVDLARRS